MLRNDRKLGKDNYILVMPGRLCSYCGEDALVIDYAPPRIKGGRIDKHKREYFYYTPVCLECQEGLWKCNKKRMDKRCWILLQFYSRRYVEALKTPSWKDSELLELKGGLRKYIKGMVIKGRFIRQRLKILRKNVSSLSKLYEMKEWE